MREIRLLVAGGGTGGHCLAGVAIIEAFKKKGGSKVLYVGAKGGMEEQLIPKEGIPLELLSISGLNRVGIKASLLGLFRLVIAFFQTLKILWTFKPTAVIGVGGYSSGPILLLAFRAKHRILIEQNSVPGWTNRILRFFVDTVCISFPKSEAWFRNNRVVLTGNPVRARFKTLPETESLRSILVLGGSQGSMGLNSLCMTALTPLLEAHPFLHLTLQCGEKDLSRCRAHFKDPKRVTLASFFDDIENIYASSSIVICRAGASTLTELLMLGRAAIYVPLPTASNDHQKQNAMSLADLGAGILFEQSESPEALRLLLESLIQDPSRIKKMEQVAKRLAKRDAAERIVMLLDEK